MAGVFALLNAPVYCPAIALMCVLVWKASRPYATQLPASCATVGDLTKAMLRLNYRMNVDKGPKPTQDEVWEKLRAILVDELGVEPAAITPDAQFVRDLGLD